MRPVIPSYPIISHYIPSFSENAFNCIQYCDVLHISPFEFIYTFHIVGSTVYLMKRFRGLFVLVKFLLSRHFVIEESSHGREVPEYMAPEELLDSSQ